MTAQEIITKFELQVSDVTELSSQEELDLLNKVYLDVCADRPWEFLKTQASGTILSDATGSYITLPDNFAFLSENNQSTLNNIGVDNNSAPIVIFVGTNYRPIQIVNFSDRRQFLNHDGYAYVSLSENKIRFCYPPTETTYEFDYIKVPAELGLSDSPVFPARFHDMIFYNMATENSILQLSDKAKSYAAENLALAQKTFSDMCYWDSKLQVN